MRCSNTSGRWTNRFFTGFLLMPVLFCTGCNEKEVKKKEPPQKQEQVQEKATPEKRPNLLKRKTSEILDKQKAMAENPNLVEVENRITGKDPLTISLEAYISASSRINLLNFQHQIDLMRAMNDNRPPSYEEIMKLIKQTKMEFNALPDYQWYAYDAKEGKFLILEDPEAKKNNQGK